MKDSSRTLREPEVPLPLRFPVKVIVEHRPGGVPADYAPIVMTADPEADDDEIVRAKAWDQRPGYQPSDVWVDAGF